MNLFTFLLLATYLPDYLEMMHYIHIPDFNGQMFYNVHVGIHIVVGSITVMIGPSVIKMVGVSKTYFGDQFA